MNLINNLILILSSKELFLSSFLFSSVGIGSFFLAIKLCCLKTFFSKAMKYLMTFISIAFTTSFFLLLNEPKEFIANPLYWEIAKVSLWMVVSWVIVYKWSQWYMSGKDYTCFCKTDYRDKIEL